MRRNLAPHHAETNASSSAPSAYGKLALIALPTFGQLIAEPAFVLIDTAIVGQLGDSALAGLALGSTIILTAVGLCVFLAYATTSQVARYFGAGRWREGLQAGIDSLWLSLLIGIVLAASLFFAAAPLCYALGGRGDALAQGIAYTRAVVLGAPGMLLVYAANGLYRGLQKVNITLIVAICGAVLNTVLDVLFVIVGGWGVAGSGFATFIAQWFMGIALLVPAVRWARRGGATLHPHWGSIIDAGKDGFPLFLRTFALRAGLVATVAAAGALGTEVLASYQVVSASWNFVLNALDSVAIAGQTMVGAALGAKDVTDTRHLTRASMRAGLIAGAVGGIIFAMLGFAIPQAFSANPSVQQLITMGMVITGIALPLQGWMWAADGILIGAGDFRYLAWTCTLVSAAYIGVLGSLVIGIAPHIPSKLISCGLLWVAFDFVLMGGRAITNGLRIRGSAWMSLP